MSLAQAIIYGKVQDIQKILNEGVKLDEIDEYGYTPLIQTAIMNDVEKAEVILKAGADANFSDLTGRTALHWAADYNNLELCQLLLKHGAKANAYTIAGQPVMVMPLLRHQKPLLDLFTKNRGDIDFAQDFITSKLLAHRFELKGRVDIVDNTNTFIEIDYEGFYLEFTISVVLNSLMQFQNNYGARHMRHQFDKLQKIIQCFEVANQLIQLQHYNIKVEEHQQKINSLLQQDVLIIPIGCQGHAIIMVRVGKYLIRCDRGEYGRDHGTVIVYEMGNPKALTNKLITHLIYKRTTREDINQELPKLLRLKVIDILPISEQITGNCSWANVEAAIPAIIYILSKDDKEKDAMEFFNEWVKWDQNRTLHFCTERFNTTESRARQATYATLLCAILFQACDYNNMEDMQRAKKIVSVVAPSEFKYILENYYQIYTKQGKNKMGKNFTEILDDFGVKL